jgi:hypothetical protein
MVVSYSRNLANSWATARDSSIFDQDRWQILALDQVPEKTLEIMSALTRKQTPANVRYGPKADIGTLLIDNLEIDRQLAAPGVQ